MECIFFKPTKDGEYESDVYGHIIYQLLGLSLRGNSPVEIRARILQGLHESYHEDISKVVREMTLHGISYPDKHNSHATKKSR